MILYLGGQFSFYLHGHPPQVELELKEPARLSDILARLGVPVEEIGLAVINDELVDPQAAFVSQQDVVKLYPPVSGG